MRERQFLPFLKGVLGPRFHKFSEAEIRDEYFSDRRVGSAMISHNSAHTFYEDRALPTYQKAIGKKAKIPRAFKGTAKIIFADVEKLVDTAGDNVRRMDGIPERLKHPHD